MSTCPVPHVERSFEGGVTQVSFRERAEGEAALLEVLLS